MTRAGSLVAALFLATSLGATTAEEYAARRAEVARRIGPDGMLILTSSTISNRNGDVDWPFRQTDDLLYLTGLDEPETSLVLLPSEPEHSEIIFARDRDPLTEVWNGRIPSFDEVSKRTGVAEVVSSSKLDTFIRAAMEGRTWGTTTVYRSYKPPAMPKWMEKVRSGKAQVWLAMEHRNFGEALTSELGLVAKLRTHYPELQFRDVTPLLVAMRMTKSPAEIAHVQKAVDVTVAAHKAAMKRSLTAKFEYEIEATIEYTFRSLGACCWGFPSIVASGRNATTLHYETNNDPIPAGALVLADIGAEVDGYTADITRTWPSDGTFSEDQRAIYAAVLRAQNETIPLMRPGVFMRDIHEKAIQVLGEDLLKLGLITKNERDQVRMYFFHGLGHQLGLRVHDVSDRQRRLEPNQIVTNEPGIYVRKTDVLANDTYEALSADEQASIAAALDRYDGIGVRLEDDILITDGAPRNLSAAAPRAIEDVEKLLAESAAP